MSRIWPQYRGATSDIYIIVQLFVIVEGLSVATHYREKTEEVVLGSRKSSGNPRSSNRGWRNVQFRSDLIGNLGAEPDAPRLAKNTGCGWNAILVIGTVARSDAVELPMHTQINTTH